MMCKQYFKIRAGHVSHKNIPSLPTFENMKKKTLMGNNVSATMFPGLPKI